MKYVEYVMKNKDNNILTFITEKTKNDIENVTVLAKKIEMFPSFLPLRKSIKNWIEDRKFSSDRMYAEQIKNTYGDKNLLSYIDASFGLSLNDTYWIVPADKNYKWEDYNLYNNNFDGDIKLSALFGRNIYKKTGFIFSPEYTTKGILKKCWYRDSDRKIYLYKGSTKVYANGGKEAYAEYYASQILDMLGFHHVKYDLVRFSNETFCTCRLFTNNHVGFLSIQSDSEKERIEEYGKEAFEDLMFFDGLIGNLDRHYGNWGVYIGDMDDGINYGLIGAAPIFDNGNNYLNLLTLKEYDNFSEDRYRTFQGYRPLDQAMKYLQYRHLEGLEKIISTSFNHPKFNEFEEYTSKFEDFIKRRAELILKLDQSSSPTL